MGNTRKREASREDPRRPSQADGRLQHKDGAPKLNKQEHGQRSSIGTVSETDYFTWVKLLQLHRHCPVSEYTVRISPPSWFNATVLDPLTEDYTQSLDQWISFLILHQLTKINL